MEKKTIGTFIAALRKANGMTQKELAEKLNVSDKTVSRWERNEGVPDLSLIPVIAEVFGVTCDELLRGQRRPMEQRIDAGEINETTQKGDRQRQRLLKSTLSQYQTRTCIAMGISVVGMIAALIGNLAFLKAVLGFLLGAIFFAASIVCQAVFINRAFLSVEDAGLEEAELLGFKRNIIVTAERSFGLTAAFIGFTFPLILMDAYMGLSADNMFIFGTIGTLITLAIYCTVCFFANGRMLKNGVYAVSEKQANNRQLKVNIGSTTALVLVATLIFHGVGSETLWSAGVLAGGTVFNDYESFIAYMEQDVPYTHGSGATGIEQVTPPAYYNGEGEEISEDEALKEQLFDLDHNVVCEYVRRNQSVTQISYESKSGTILPIRVRTYDDYISATAKRNMINVCFFGVYIVEIAAAFAVYYMKRAK